MVDEDELVIGLGGKRRQTAGKGDSRRRGTRAGERRAPGDAGARLGAAGADERVGEFGNGWKARERILRIETMSGPRSAPRRLPCGTPGTSAAGRGIFVRCITRLIDSSSENLLW